MANEFLLFVNDLDLHISQCLEEVKTFMMVEFVKAVTARRYYMVIRDSSSICSSFSQLLFSGDEYESNILAFHKYGFFRYLFFCSSTVSIFCSSVHCLASFSGTRKCIILEMLQQGRCLVSS